MCVRETNHPNISSTRSLFHFMKLHELAIFNEKKLTLEGAPRFKAHKSNENFVQFRSNMNTMSFLPFRFLIVRNHTKGNERWRNEKKLARSSCIRIVCEKFIAYCWTSEFIFCLSLHHTLLTSEEKITIKQTSFEGCHNPKPFLSLDTDSPDEKCFSRE